MGSEPLRLCDVGPRDGLQNDDRILPAATRAELCARLSAAGLQRVEAVSFVNDSKVPAMADPEGVLAALPAGPTLWTALILNERGLDRAVEAGVERINLTVACTETFNQRNQGIDLEGARTLLQRIGERCPTPLTVTLSVSFGCPYEGEVDPRVVEDMAARAVAAGADEVVLADTIGVAEPAQVGELVCAVSASAPVVGGHFHDTRRNGVANAVAAYDAGATLIDASVGGTGGCPFAPGATGNVATEDVVAEFEARGIATGVDIAQVLRSAAWLADVPVHAPAG